MIQIINSAILFSCPFTRGQEVSNAAPGLVQFPCNHRLMNTYHFMRSGQSLLESEDFISTNPLLLTNREDALSPLGIHQVQDACKSMMALDINPSVVKYSLAAKSIDSANIVASEMKIGRNRIVPEYTFMDPRGIGKWDMQRLSVTEEAVWAMDHARTGKDGRGGLPPSNDDGTPNETLSDQATRLRELLSLLETHCSGDTILLIFPDGTGPALLSALIAGIPFSRVHELNFAPGEIRFNVTYDRVLEDMPNDPLPSYTAAISRGINTLEDYEANPNQFLDIREEERLAEEEIFRKQLAKKEIDTELHKKVVNEKAKFRQKKVLTQRKVSRNLAKEHTHLQEKKVFAKEDSTQNTLRNRESLAAAGLLTVFALNANNIEEENENDIENDPYSEQRNSRPNIVEINDEQNYAPSLTSDEVHRMEKITTVVETTNEIPELKDTLDIKLNNELATIDSFAGEVKPDNSAFIASPELKRMEELVESAPFDVPELTTDLSEAEASTLNFSKRIVDANEAMEEYLSRDDGETDWLKQMSELMDS